jgi:hypothetical protein
LRGEKDKKPKRRFEAIKNKQEINHLKTITKVYSANLTTTNHYTLDKNVIDLVLQKEAAEEAPKAAAQGKKEAAELK